MFRNFGEGEKGFTFVMTLFVLLLTGIAVTATFTSITSTARSAHTLLTSNLALYAAESGVNEALWWLNLNGKSSLPHSPEWTMVGGVNTFTVSEPGVFDVTVTEGSTAYTITSAGQSQGITRTVQVRVSKPIPANNAVEYVVSFNPGNGGYYESISAPPISSLPSVTLINPPPYQDTDLLITANTTSETPIAAETISIGGTKGKGNKKVDITINADIIARGDIYIQDGVTINGNVISEQGDISIGQQTYVNGSVIAMAGSVNWDKSGNGPAYGHSNHTQVDGLVYGVSVAFGNNCVINGSVLAEHVFFHTNNTVDYVPENLPSSIIKVNNPNTTSRTWQLL